MIPISNSNHNKESLGKADQAFAYIQKQIFERKILPGHRIVERSLAQECGMSKTPVREALQRLKEVGLVTGDFQNGVYVINFTAKDALEIFDLREVLEGLSARLATKHADEENIKELQELLDDSKTALDSKDAKLYSEVDQSFHFTLITIGGNHRLLDIYQRLRLQAKLLMHSSMRLPGRGMEKSYEEHLKVFEAIKKRDVDLSEKMARQHILNTCEAVVKWLQEGFLL